MKQQTFKQLFSVLVLAFCCVGTAKAALITTQFSELVGNQGTVDVQLSLGDAEVVEGFQVFFSETLFSNLSIIDSPVNWDSYIGSPLLSNFIFDSYNPSGLTSGYARLAFTYLGQGTIQALNYELYNNDFEVTGSGVAANVKTSVPEPSSLALILLGLIAVKARSLNSTSRKVDVNEVIV